MFWGGVEIVGSDFLGLVWFEYYLIFGNER